jgi:hypothetical protein
VGGNKEEDGTMTPLRDTDGDGFYEVDLSWWPVGSYRLNLHTAAGEPSPYGSPLNDRRDQDCSWAPIDSGRWGEGENESIRSFLHKEENGAGFSLRILIRPDRSVEAFGDMP